LPIPGASSVARLEEDVRAFEIHLGDQDFERIEETFLHGVVKVDRYSPEMMTIINI
jgi:aryl-alcohol dehydrogenase-like predicted oxidoreductase